MTSDLLGQLPHRVVLAADSPDKLLEQVFFVDMPGIRVEGKMASHSPKISALAACNKSWTRW